MSQSAKANAQIRAWSAEGLTISKMLEKCRLNEEDLFDNFACTRAAIMRVLGYAKYGERKRLLCGCGDLIIYDRVRQEWPKNEAGIEKTYLVFLDTNGDDVGAVLIDAEPSEERGDPQCINCMMMSGDAVLHEIGEIK